MSEFLFKVSAIFLVVSLVVGLFNRIKIPGIVGLIIAGIVIGPFGLHLLDDRSQIDVLAELGIILLMFSIGLDFNRDRLVELRRASGIGLFQIIFCLATVFGGYYFVFDASWQKAIFFGFLLSHTSSTLMLKIYSERGEISTAPARLGLGVSITQDLASVPMLVCLPLLALGDGISAGVFFSTKLFQSAGILAVTAGTLYWIVPRALHFVVQGRSRELMLFFLMLVCLGTSWATYSAGLSGALGAFVAGLALAKSHFSHQIHAEVSPLRDLLVSLFFISVGMLVNTTSLATYAHIYLPALAATLFIKYFSGFLPVLIWGYPLRVATLTGVSIAQIGEFSFVLALVGLSQGLIGDVEYQVFIITGVLSMLASPFLTQLAPSFYNLIDKIGFSTTIKNGRYSSSEHSDELSKLNGHVIIGGYGLNGRNLARALRSLEIPYAATELVPSSVAEAQLANERVYFGDCTRPDVLKRMQIERARVFVVAISDPQATRRAVQVARNESATVHIIVRTRYVYEIEHLLAIGANEVIPEEFETSLEILARTLHEFQIPRRTVDQAVLALRGDSYHALREQTGLTPMSELLEGLSLALEIENVKIRAEDAAIGKSLMELSLPSQTGAVVLAIRRQEEVITSPGADLVLLEDDIVILVGRHEQLIGALELIQGARKRDKTLDQ